MTRDMMTQPIGNLWFYGCQATMSPIALDPHGRAAIPPIEESAPAWPHQATTTMYYLLLLLFRLDDPPRRTGYTYTYGIRTTPWRSTVIPLNLRCCLRPPSLAWPATSTCGRIDSATPCASLSSVSAPLSCLNPPGL